MKPKIEHKILEVLQQFGTGASVNQIRNAMLGRYGEVESMSSIQQRLRYMVAENLLYRPERGVYTILKGCKYDAV